MRVRFDAFQFDSQTRELTRGPRTLTLSRQAFRLLEALLSNRPRALTHQELYDLLWPKTFVARTSLARLVTEVRKALGDTTRSPRYVRTVYGFGYAFCGESTDAAVPLPSPRAAFPCGLLWGGHEIGLREGDNLIGRAAECEVRIDSSQVSRQHARVVVSQAEATLEDLGSKNGTFLRGRKLEGPTQLKDGDKLCVGPALLVFRKGYGQGSTKTARGGGESSPSGR